MGCLDRIILTLPSLYILELIHPLRYFQYKKPPVPHYPPSYLHHQAPAKAPSVHHAAPSYFTGHHHSSPVAYPKQEDGHAPYLHGGLAAPSYFAGVGQRPSHGDPDAWGSHGVPTYEDADPWGGGHSPTGNGGGYASPSYFGGGYGNPSSHGHGHSPSAYAPPQAYGGGYYGGHSNHRPKVGNAQRNHGSVPVPAQAPVSFRNPGVPTIVDSETPFAFRQQASPAAPFAPNAPFAPSAPVIPTETTPGPIAAPIPAPVAPSAPFAPSAPAVTPSPVDSTPAPVVDMPVAPSAPFSPSAPAANFDTIAQILASDERTTILYGLIVDVGLLPAIEGLEAATVFAPTNAAFEALGLDPDTDQATIESVLLYHVVDVEVLLVDGSMPYTTLNGAELVVTGAGTAFTVNDANIEDSYAASNGLVYIIDAVLIPPEEPSVAPVDMPVAPSAPFAPSAPAAMPISNFDTIAQILAIDERTTILYGLIVDVGLLPAIEGLEGATVFAPTNAAFIALGLPPDTDQATIESVLLYHVVDVEVLLVDGSMSYTTLNGAELVVTGVGNEFKVNDANIETQDSYTASNGLVYIIDAVLIPPEEPSPTPAPSDMGPTIVTSEDMPTIASEDMPTLMGSEDMPTRDEPTPAPVQGPTLAPMEETPSPAGESPIAAPFAPSSPVAGAQPGSEAPAAEAQPGSEAPAAEAQPGSEAPVAVFTPAMTPSMFTPSMITPSMLMPFAPSMPVGTQPPVETPVPTDGEDPDADSRLFNSEVAIDPFVVTFVGSFEMTNQNIYLIINSINGLVAPYLMERMSDVLKYIDLEVNPIQEAANDNSGTEGGRLLRALESGTAQFGIGGKLQLESDEESALSQWTSEKATLIIEEFFSGSTLQELLDRYRNSGLALDSIEIDGETTDAVVTDEGVTTQNTNDGGSSSSGEGGTKNLTAVIVASICGGFAFIVLAVAMYMNTRRQRKKFRSAREMHSMSQDDGLNLRSGQDDLQDCNNSASHVSFPHLDADEVDLEDFGEMDDDTLKAIKGKKKRSSKRGDIERANSWASISLASEKKKKKRKKKRAKSVTPISARHSFNGDADDDVYLSPLDLDE